MRIGIVLTRKGILRRDRSNDGGGVGREVRRMFVGGGQGGEAVYRAAGGWQMTDDRWHVADGGWRMGDGGWRMADCIWELADFPWGVGSGRSAVSGYSRVQASRQTGNGDGVGGGPRDPSVRARVSPGLRGSEAPILSGSAER